MKHGKLSMKKILIVKTGCLPRAIVEKRGDMENYFMRGMGLPESLFVVSSVHEGDVFPILDGISGIVVTGSSHMITDDCEWICRTACSLAEAVRRDIPVLGVCFGHQLLAHATGGFVHFNPNGREIGTVSVRLAGKAKTDELLKVIPEDEICVQVSHRQSVMRLPEGAEALASNKHESNHAFRLKGRKAWGLQFHPELDAETVRLLIKSGRREIKNEGLDPEKLSRECFDTEAGVRILKRFAEIVMHNAESA